MIRSWFWLSLGLSALLIACTGPSKCTRGELGCACRAGNICDGTAVCVAGSCVSRPPRDAGAKDASSSFCLASSFDVACRSYCLALCKNEASYCTTSRCESDFCEPSGGAVVSESCRANCGRDPDPVACLRDLCRAQLSLGCHEFGYDTDAGTFASACFKDDPQCDMSN